MPDPSEEKPQKGKLPWWAMALIGSMGAFVPQLCSLIPQAVGSLLCKFVLAVAVGAFGGQTPQNPQPLPPSVVPVAECPPERRTSNGYCLP